MQKIYISNAKKNKLYINECRKFKQLLAKKIRKSENFIKLIKYAKLRGLDHKKSQLAVGKEGNTNKFLKILQHSNFKKKYMHLKMKIMNNL